MKIKLLNDGGFYGMEYVKFPALVEAEFYPKDDYCVAHYQVISREIVRVGGNETLFSGSKIWNFLPSEVEVIHES